MKKIFVEVEHLITPGGVPEIDFERVTITPFDIEEGPSHPVELVFHADGGIDDGEHIKYFTMREHLLQFIIYKILDREQKTWGKNQIWASSYRHFLSMRSTSERLLCQGLWMDKEQYCYGTLANLFKNVKREKFNSETEHLVGILSMIKKR